MEKLVPISRRTILEISGTLAGAVAFGFAMPSTASTHGVKESDGSAINAFVRISRENTVTLVMSKSEMGQGAHTGCAMCIAEELEVDWASVQIEMAPSRPEYRTGSAQSTGGSSTIRLGFDTLRKTGAEVRELLRQAAANYWKLPVEETYADHGAIHNRVTQDSLSYGALAPLVKNTKLSGDIKLKKPGEWKIIGTTVPPIDIPSKVDGSAQYGVDISIPGMLVAAVMHCPVFGGRLGHVDPKPALRIPGVKHVIPLASAVIVAADNFWLASKGCDALRPEWDEPPLPLNDADIEHTLDKEVARGGEIALEHGRFDDLAGLKAVEATYHVPYLAHSPMEPMSATVSISEDKVEVWAGVQTQTRAQQAVAKALGVEEAKVTVHTPQLGGSFGRRLESDFVVEAALAAKAAGAPVKLIWSREQDTRHSYYRPAAKLRFKGVIDNDGAPVGLNVVLAEDAFAAGFVRTNPSLKPTIGPRTSVWVAGEGYGIKNVRYAYAHPKLPVPIGAWRAVQHSHNGFFGESMIDEMAVAAGADPLEYRIKYAATERYKSVLRAVAKLSKWGTALPNGSGRGVAFVDSFDSVVAQVVEVTVKDRRQLRVDRVSCVIDCGVAVHPSYVKAQMEGSIVYGLTAALFGEITLENGAVQQANFNDYRMLKLDLCPEIDVEILNSDSKIGGTGEPGLPPIAPALTNAIFNATSERIRRLPVIRSRFEIV